MKGFLKNKMFGRMSSNTRNDLFGRNEYKTLVVLIIIVDNITKD